MFTNVLLSIDPQWAKERFEELFEKPAEVVNAYLSQPNFVEAAKQSGETNQLLKIRSYLVENKPLGFDECIVWARQQFEVEYSNEIRQLLFSLPKDLVRCSFLLIDDERWGLTFFGCIGRSRKKELHSGRDRNALLIH